MRVRSLREAIAELVSFLRSEAVRFHGHKGPRQTQEVEELACVLLDYGRMRIDVRSRRGLVVEVKDLAFRLRETRRTVTDALFLLESQGHAKRTKHSGRWKLQV
jgi:hypothetical protein